MKAALPANEAARLETLRQYDVLDTDTEESFEDLTRLAAHICQTPIALISFVDENRQWFKSRLGIADSELPRDIAFCAHAILEDGLFVVADARADERFAANPLVTSRPFIRFYAGEPLVSPEGFKLGTLCVIDRVPRQLDAESIAALRAVRNQVMALLDARREIAFLRAALDKHKSAVAELRERLSQQEEAGRTSDAT